MNIDRYLKIIEEAIYKIQSERESTTQKCSEKSAVKFNEKELKKMPKFFRTEYKYGRIKTKIKERPSDGRYEIRCQIRKVKIYASARTVEETKIKFIERLQDAFVAKEVPKKVLFGDYIMNWLETVKKPYIKEPTYKYYTQLFNCDILPQFKNRVLASITQGELQNFLNKYTLSEKFRTAHKLHQVFSAVFEYAVADGIITRSPMAKVVAARYEEKHGISLTREEERQLVESLKKKPDSINRQAFVFLVYTGLRRSELASVSISEQWVTVTNAKQRKGFSVKQRRIPISPMLKKMLPFIEVEKIKQISKSTLTGKFKLLMPNHHLHELRHTFITRCQECGIARELVSLWAGHSADSSITTTVYTHLEQFEQRQLDEILKFIYDFT